MQQSGSVSTLSELNQQGSSSPPQITTGGAIQSVLLGLAIIAAVCAFYYVGILPVFAMAAGAILGPAFVIFGLSYLLVPKKYHGTPIQDRFQAVGMSLILILVIAVVGWYLFTVVFPRGL